VDNGDAGTDTIAAASSTTGATVAHATTLVDPVTGAGTHQVATTAHDLLTTTKRLALCSLSDDDPVASTEGDLVATANPITGATKLGRSAVTPFFGGTVQV